MEYAPQISVVAIVAVGSFNPLIFRPGWLNTKGVIVGGDYDSLSIQMVHASIVSLGLPWGEMFVDRERFSIQSQQEPVIQAHDFFVKCFQLLPESPIRGVGINREVHVDAGDSSVWDRIGDRLAPKAVWG